MNLLGEYECKVDAKGRLTLPSGAKKQLEKVLNDTFVLNRDIFEPCLVLYPKQEWKRVTQQLSKLNRFVRKNALFVRRFNNGATPIELDTNGRLLITKNLLEYSKIAKDVVVCGNGERIEIWSKENYDSMLNEEVDFAALSEEVMGGIDEITE